MATPSTTRPAVPPFPFELPEQAIPALASMSWMGPAFLDWQCVMWEAFLAWPKACTAFQNELWDEWRCRFAGGAPIDA
jgi:hypothetical protein